MQRVIEYLAALDPAYPAALRGASEKEIRRLEELAGRRLPPSYRSFLETMGTGMGPLRVGAAQLHVRRVLQEYERGVEAPDGCWFLGADTNYPFDDYYLDERDREGEPRVVRYSKEGEFDESVRNEYRSLEEMLLTAAFLGLRVPRLPRRVTCVPAGGVDWSDAAREPLLAGFHRVARLLEFQPIAGTGPWSPCYERGDAALRAHQPPPQKGVSVLLAAGDEEADRLLDVLREELGLAPA